MSSANSKKNEKKRLIEEHEDFIVAPKFDNSLRTLLRNTYKDFPDGIPDSRIAKFLMMTPEEVEKEFQSAITKIREIISGKKTN